LALCQSLEPNVSYQPFRQLEQDVMFPRDRQLSFVPAGGQLQLPSHHAQKRIKFQCKTEAEWMRAGASEGEGGETLLVCLIGISGEPQRQSILAHRGHCRIHMSEPLPAMRFGIVESEHLIGVRPRAGPLRQPEGRVARGRSGE
jgi:hypothetical protein